jgi:ABC-type sugar transport system substrate-binding protein
MLTAFALKANAVDTLVKYPDVAGLVGLWSYNDPAITGAVRDAGKVGQVKIICFDEEDETLQGIKEGASIQPLSSNRLNSAIARSRSCRSYWPVTRRWFRP